MKKLVNTVATNVGHGQKYNLSSLKLCSKKDLKRTTSCGPRSAKRTKVRRGGPNWFWIEYSRMIQMTSVWSLLTYPGQTLNSFLLDMSVTAHSGWINAVLRVIGRKNFDVPTGGTCLRTSSRLSVLFLKCLCFRNYCCCRERNCTFLETPVRYSLAKSGKHRFCSSITTWHDFYRENMRNTLMQITRCHILNFTAGIGSPGPGP